LSPLVQLFTGELPPLPLQAQLGLQQSQNRVPYPIVPEVGGHVPGEPLEVEELEDDAVVELEEAAAVELDEAAVVDELDAVVPPVQFEFTHDMPLPQTCPQYPQFFGSVATFAQTLLQN
jgi:hypothetical protein